MKFYSEAIFKTFTGIYPFRILSSLGYFFESFPLVPNRSLGGKQRKGRKRGHKSVNKRTTKTTSVNKRATKTTSVNKRAGNMSLSFSCDALVRELGVSDNKQRTLLSSQVKLYGEITGCDVGSAVVNELLQQLDELVDLLHNDKNSQFLKLLSQPVCLSMGKNYAALLTQNRTRLFDTTNKFITTFTDTKRPTELKNLSCVVLTAIYGSFGREVVSFIPGLLVTILKYLKKESFDVNLSALWYAILRNGGSLEMTDSILSKYLKLLKMTESIESLKLLYGCFGQAVGFKQIDALTFRTTYHPYIQLAFDSHKDVRVQLAKSLSEYMVLLKWDLITCLELYVELYLESTTKEQETGIVESMVHLISMQMVRDPDFATHNTLVILNNLVKIFDHERFHGFTLNHKFRIMNHYTQLFTTITQLLGESSLCLLLDSIIPKLDQDLSIWNTVLLLKVCAQFISRVSSLSDGRVERFRITVWKLCLSSHYEVQVNGVLVLREIASKSPNIIKEILETCTNEVINNTKQPFSEKIATNSYGMSLIISNLVALADLDYVPKSVVEHIWTSCIGVIKENLKLTKSNHHTLAVCWISIAGVFTYRDESYLSTLVDEFLTIFEASDMTGTIKEQPLETLTVISRHLSAVVAFLRSVETTDSISKIMVESISRLRTLVAAVKLATDAGVVADLVMKRCQQIYLLCIEYVKRENSSVLIQTVANFSSLPNYTSTVKNEVITPWTKDDGFSNGLSSKFRGFEIDELLIKFPNVKYEEVTDCSIDLKPRPVGSSESSHIKSWVADITWIDQIESSLNVPVECALELDTQQTIFGDYSIHQLYSPPSKTCVVDLSMEFFSLTFPYLSTKVQLSVLETLRSNMLSKSCNESTQITQAINFSIVIHGLLTLTHKNQIPLDSQVGILLLETLRHICAIHPERYLLTLNSESIGILISCTDLKEQIPIFLKRIVDDQQAHSRAFNALILSNIYRYNASHFGNILEMLLKLVKDGHPVVHAWSMDSLATIIGRHLTMNIEKATETIQILGDCYLSDCFGKLSPVSNLNCDNDSNAVIMRVLRAIINSLGPSIKDLEPKTKQIVKNLIFSGIWLSNNTHERLEAIKMIQELIIYDHEHFTTENVVGILCYIIEGNIGKSIGSELMFTIFEEKNEVFPMTSSFKTLEVSLDFLSQLVKMSENKAFFAKIEPLIWICLERLPDSKILKNMIKERIEETYDVVWFVKLQKLYSVSKQELYKYISNSNNKILDKYKHVKTEVNVKDEEAQSIANKSEEEQKGELVDWRFKADIIEFLRQLLGYTTRDSKFYSQISSRVSEVVKISFAASTSSAIPLRLAGMKLLGEIISIYAPAKDPIYPTIPLLEQQQAQITSALMPAFQEGSTPLLACEAIKVAAMFVGSGVVKVTKLGRILKILTGALTDLHGDDEFKLSDVVVTSEVGQRRVKLAILNAWAELEILSKNENEDLEKLIQEHMPLLLPLWISTLKEFSLMRHGSFIKGEDYQACWVNLVDVIGCLTESGNNLIADLLGNDALGFYYMLYAHCIYALLRNENRLRILLALVKILDFKELIKLIYYDDIIYESMEVFERLLVTGEEEEQLVVLDITSKMFLNHFDVNQEDDFTENADKLFDIVQSNMTTATRFISSDADSKDDGLNATELQLVKKGLGSVAKMMSKFPEIIKQDLYASLLSIIANIYSSSKSSQLVPQILPILKDVIHQLIDINDISTVNNFYRTVKPSLDSPLITILTMSVLLSSAPNYLRLSQDDVDLVVLSISQGLSDQDSVPYATQAVRSILASQNAINSAIVRGLIKQMVLKTLEIDDPRLSLEILILVVKQYPTPQLYTVLITLLLQTHTKHPHLSDYIHKRMVSLITISPDSFKAVVGSLDATHKHDVEVLVKLGEIDTREEGEHIKLKAFE